jgi:hypothetical protein
MATSKVWNCDLCGQPVDRADLVRLGVRTADDRPEDADWVDTGKCCAGEPVGLAVKVALDMRKAVTDGQ